MSWIVLAIIVAVVIIGALALLGRKKEPASLPQAGRKPELAAKQAKAELGAGRKQPARAVAETKPEPSKPKAAEKSGLEPQAVEPHAEQVPGPAQPLLDQKKKEQVGQAPIAGHAVAESRLKRPQDVEGIRKGLGKTRAKEGFFGQLASLITGRKEIDPAITDELEEVLLSSDVGVAATEKVLARIREGLDRKELDNPERVWDALRLEATRILSIGEGGLALRTKPTVVLMVGVNGCGKTTTIGKLATQLKAEGKQVVLAAGDTFRAAAVQQLEVWGRRVGCEVVKGKDGADPGAVIFEAIQKASSTGADVVLADTAGRLHTKTPLMDELKKISKTMGKAMQGAPHETLLVIDATNGQNAVAQSRQFAEAMPLTGLVLTKLDGTAKGGVVLGICDELKVPVRFIGLGERADDLRAFDAEAFVEALLGNSASREAAA